MWEGCFNLTFAQHLELLHIDIIVANIKLILLREAAVDH